MRDRHAIDTHMIEEFIRSELIRERFTKFKDTDNLIETGIIDSLGIQRLLLYLEAAFSIHISDDELIPDNFETIDAICSLCWEKLGQESVPVERSLKPYHS